MKINLFLLTIMSIFAVSCWDYNDTFLKDADVDDEDAGVFLIEDSGCDTDTATETDTDVDPDTDPPG